MNTQKISKVISKVLSVFSWIVGGATLVLAGVLGFMNMNLSGFVNVMKIDSDESAMNTFSFGGIQITDLENKNAIDFQSIFESKKVFVAMLAMLILSFVILRLLRKLFVNVSKNETFVRKNLYIIYGIAGLQLVGDIVSTVFDYLYADEILRHMHFTGVELTATAPDWGVDLFPAVIIFIIALFFSQAIKLQEEQDLTI